MDAKRTREAIKIRRKIVALFSRAQLDKLSGMPKPWLADLATVKQSVMIRWPEVEIRKEFLALMDKA